MYNTLLYIGLGLMLFGFIAFLVCAFMENYYDRKLKALDKKMRKDDKWRAEQRNVQIPFQDNPNS
jgi:hypothetical protein